MKRFATVYKLPKVPGLLRSWHRHRRAFFADSNPRTVRVLTIDHIVIHSKWVRMDHRDFKCM